MAVDLQVNDPLNGSGARGGDATVALVERAASAALEDRDAREGTLSITLLDDAGMEAMNRQWKGRSGPTDVLAFALNQDGEPLVGDVYVGVERAAAQAAEHGESRERELARLAIHGTLHVLGMDHPEEGREESEMWRHQERILDGLDAG